MNEKRYRTAETALFNAAGIEPVEHWVDLPAVGARARVLEVGEGRPALFLSGGPDAGATWAYAAAATTGVKCLLLDRPGTGLSTPPTPVPDAARLSAYVSDLTREVLDALSIKTAALVGCSFGGFSALRSALALGGRVDRVVLAGCPPSFPAGVSPASSAYSARRQSAAWSSRPRPTRASVRFSLRIGSPPVTAFRRDPRPMLDWIRAWQRDTDTMRNDTAMIVACGTRTGFDPRLDLRTDELASIGQPCLVLVGTDDPVGGETVSASWRRGFLPEKWRYGQVRVTCPGSTTTWRSAPASANSSAPSVDVEPHNSGSARPDRGGRRRAASPCRAWPSTGLRATSRRRPRPTGPTGRPCRRSR